MSAAIDPTTAFAEAGLVLTLQRRVIWEAFHARTDHPTADTIFEAVKDSHPGLSRTTVYRTLETFVELGLADRLAHPGIAVRFDPRTDLHHHVVCDVCGEVTDVTSKKLDAVVTPRLPGGFEAREVSVLVRGTCSRCQG